MRPEGGGIAWILAASVSFAVMGALTKHAMAGGDVWQVVFWRSVVVAAVAWAAMARAGISPRPGNLPLMGWRALVGLGAMLLFFWSLGEIPLGAATTLLYTSPVFTVLWAARLGGEARTSGALPMALLAFVGVALLLRPGSLDLDLGSLAALASGVLAALAYLAVRRLRQSDHPARIVWFFAVVSTLATAIPALRHGLPATSEQRLALLGVGLTAAGGQLGMTHAYRLERAAIVSPLSYATVVFSYLLGVAFWGEILDPLASAGLVLVVLAGVGLGRVAAAP